MDLPRPPAASVERRRADLQARPAYREHVMARFDDPRERAAF